MREGVRLCVGNKCCAARSVERAAAVHARATGGGRECLLHVRCSFSAFTREEVEAAGASLLNTGIGWHEARVPTIATSVPRAAFAHLSARLRGAVPGLAVTAPQARWG